MQEVTSKSMDGITDLVVVAPIKDGFIDAFENITYAARLKLVAEALNKIRTSAREYERLQPFSDVTERIMNLLDFRIGVLDNDLFGMERTATSGANRSYTVDKPRLVARRYLYLTATFEGGWEPYMRLIWRPLGAFLDLLFCNCEGYVTASEHSCDEYLQWVRDNQMDSAIFYSTTGLTTRDERYLSRLERLVREGKDSAATAGFTMPHPEPEAEKVRAANMGPTMRLGLEALNVLYKLADFYPPEWLCGRELGDIKLDEGHRLIRATDEILRGFRPFIPYVPDDVKTAYAVPLNWYTTGLKELERRDNEREAAMHPDPHFSEGEVQAGILKAHGSKADPVRHGALLMFTIRNAAAARVFVASLPLEFAGDATVAKPGVHHSVAFTPQGLLRMGVEREVVNCLPKEFRDGMAARSSVIGDQRENHPRNWVLPERYAPDADATARKLPPVELDEIDIVVQLRANGPDSEQAITRRIAELAAKAKAGASLEAVEFLHVDADSDGRFRDAFGFVDGISQPRLPVKNGEYAEETPRRDRVKLGEVLVGFGNSRGDGGAGPYETLEGQGQPAAWRARFRKDAQEQLLRHGSFLVVRKIGQNAPGFTEWVRKEAERLIKPVCDKGVGIPLSQSDAEALIRAKIMGRDDTGRPIAKQASGDLNDFDYGRDAKGLGCPHAAHIRRSNPRRTETVAPAGVEDPVQVLAEFGRPTPRILRRGMMFGTNGDSNGLMFMAYNASIAEQYEVIQRWLNGGNSTDVASAQNDPLTGVTPRQEGGAYRFVETIGCETYTISLRLPPAAGAADNPGRHPFTPLYWGLYLFVPSGSAIKWLCAQTGDYGPMREPLEDAVGRAMLERITALPDAERGAEWKRLLEDFWTKDPAERDISPHVWSAIRYYCGGVIGIGAPIEKDSRDPGYDWAKPNWEKQDIVVVAGTDQANTILSDWRNFSSEEQVRRIKDSSGPIYVAQQPDNQYRNPELTDLGLDYHREAERTNAAIFAVTEEEAYDAGYSAGKAVLARLIGAAQTLKHPAFKVELRRQYIQEAIGHLWRELYGLPDDDAKFMDLGGWSWQRIVSETSDADPSDHARTKARCPGDFLASSRATFYPRPGPVIKGFGAMHGRAILEAAERFVDHHHAAGGPDSIPLMKDIFAAFPPDPDPVENAKRKAILARNIAGTMVGAIPPMEANLRSILLDWLTEKTLWRHQAALHEQAALHGVDGGADVRIPFEAAKAALWTGMTQAICKRPAPDLLYRTATGDVTIEVKEDVSLPDRQPVRCKEGDLVVVSLVSVAQRSLMKSDAGDVSIVFGGNRTAPVQGYDSYPSGPVHACPAQKLSMGAMLGMCTALLDVGRIQAMPAALIVEISEWPVTPA